MDNSIVKDIIVLRPLSIAPLDSLLDVAFKNQCAGLEEILDKDAEKRSIHPSSESVSVQMTTVSFLYAYLLLSRLR